MEIKTKQAEVSSYIETAKSAVCLLEQAILDALADNASGLYNSELARLLQIESDYKGKQTNYLTYSILGGLLKSGKIREERRGSKTYYMKVDLQ